MTVFYVAIGGALGAVLRYLTLVAVGFPIGTLVVNVAGSIFMGIAFVLLTQKGLDRMAVFVMTGILGGFTTFSAFSLDAYRLYERGDLGLAAMYVLASVVLAVVGLVAGIALARGLM